MGLFRKKKKPVQDNSQLELLEQAKTFYDNNNYEQALPIFEKFAYEGNDVAQFYYGNMFNLGFGVKRDQEKACQWFIKAAENGNANAANMLGWIYSGDMYGIKDLKKSLYWYQKAAERGNGEAQYHCSIIYENGIGTEVDLAKAQEYMRQSKESGYYKAQSISLSLKKDIEKHSDVIEENLRSHMEKQKEEKKKEYIRNKMLEDMKNIEKLLGK